MSMGKVQKEAHDSMEFFRDELRQWMSNIGLKRGHRPNHPDDLREAFAEYLEDRHPALRDKFEKTYRRALWLRDIKKVFAEKKVRKRTHTHLTTYYLFNQVVLPKRRERGVASFRVCSECGTTVRTPQFGPPTPIEELKAQLAAIEAATDKDSSS